MKDGLEAEGKPRVGASRRGARMPGGEKQAKAEKLRVQYHLGKKTVERLGVHASLVHKSESAVVEEVLLAYLVRFGKGRIAFEDTADDLVSTLSISDGQAAHLS